jgi:hypothetical protein
LRYTRLLAVAAFSAAMTACNGNGAGNAPPFPAPSPNTQSTLRQLTTSSAFEQNATPETVGVRVHAVGATP